MSDNKRLGHPYTKEEVLAYSPEQVAQAYIVVLADRNQLRAKIMSLENKLASISEVLNTPSAEFFPTFQDVFDTIDNKEHT